MSCMLRLALTIGLLAALVAVPASPSGATVTTPLQQPAVWSWFSDPRAVHHAGTLYVGYATTTGVHVGAYRAAAQTWGTFQVGELSHPDDHSAPSVGVLPDGRIVAAWSELAGNLWTRVSTNPGDVGTWDDPVQVAEGEYTYTNLLWLESESLFYLFSRRHDTGNGRTHVYWTSADGAAWASETELVASAGRPYAKFSATADRIDAVFTDDHPAAGTDNSIWHAYYDGAWRQSDGTALGTAPYAPSDLSLVYDGVDPSPKAWIWDIAPGPVIAYATFGNQDDHLYRYATWDGATWTSQDITTAGGSIEELGDEPYYSGGLVLDHTDPRQVYLSRETGESAWSVERWQTDDSGATWSTPLVLTPAAAEKNIRPVVPRGNGATNVLWLAGSYTGFTDFDTSLAGDPPLLVAAVQQVGTVQTARAQVRAVVTWLGCDVITGRRIAELPDITGDVSRVLSAYTSAGLSMPAPVGGPGSLPTGLIERATQPIRSMIVLVVNDVPSWAGWVRDRHRGSQATWDLPCVTLEGYLRARRVGNHTFAQQDEASIAATLAADAGNITGVGSGIPLVVDAVATGTVRDRTYLMSDRQTVYDALRELSAVGLEWTIDLDWEDDRQQVVTRILRIRRRIGVTSATPKARFATRSSSEATYVLEEDHSDGRYANYLVAYAPGEGEDQLASAPAIDQGSLNGGAPIVELHWQPSSSIVEIATLDEHAEARLARVRNGALTWQIASRWDQPPRLNVDWALGDDVGWDLVGHGHPTGVAGVGRAIGWTFDPRSGLASPILLDPSSDPEETS